MNNRIALSLVLSASLFSVKAKAEESDLEKLYARQHSINTLSAALGTYANEKKALLNEERGLILRLKAYTRGTKEWVTAYESLAARANTLKNFSEVQAFVFSESSKQANLRSKLHGQYQRLNEDLRFLETKLQKLPAFEGSEQLAAQKDEFTRSVQKVQGLILRIRGELESAETSSAELAQKLDADLFTAKGLKAALDAGIATHSPEVQALTNFVKAETFQARFSSELEAEVLDLQNALYLLEGVKAEKLASQVSNRCQSIENSIRAESFSEADKNRLSSEVQGLCGPVLQNYEKNVKPRPRGEFARSMHQKNLKNLKFQKACNSEGPACSSLRKLKAIDDETILKSKPEALAYLEQLWGEFRTQLERRP